MPNTIDDIQQKLISAIQSVQRDSGLPEPTLTGSSCPTKELDGFDSPLWIVVIGVVALDLGVAIPSDVNIFIDDDGKRQLTIKESAARIYNRVPQGDPAK